MTPTTRTTLRAFIEQHGLTMESARAKRNPHADPEGWGDDATHWLCTISREDPDNNLSTPFSMGSAHTGEPDLERVLDCLASDAAGFENARDFDDWCGEYGYDTDSRRAHATYLVIGDQAKAFRRFFGTGAYETLLWNVDR